MRLVEPVVNIELRDREDHKIVVFAFPYRSEIVDAVREIPGRRFDWNVREWWAPATEQVAPYVRSVVDQFPELRVHVDVEDWLADQQDTWIGRVTTAKIKGQGWFRLHPVSGTLPEELQAAVVVHGEAEWLPFTQQVGEALLELRGARMDQRAIRCATRLELDIQPPPATLTYIRSAEAPRFGLDINWDPEALAPFMEIPEADKVARAIPADPFMFDELEKLVADYGIEIAPEARDAFEQIRADRDEAHASVAASLATEAPPLAIADRLGGTLEPFQNAGVNYVLNARRAFLADEQGLGKTVQALAALEQDDAYPAIVVCPASLKLNWERETGRWLPHRTVHVINGTAPVFPKVDITILNYEVVHHHDEALKLRRPKALILDESHYVKNPQARRTKATRRLAESLPRNALCLALSGTPVLNRPEELVSQLRIIGRLADFGSGARFANRFRSMGAEPRLHWHLRRRCFVRRKKSEVLPQLPAKRRVILPVALNNEREYRLAEEDVIAWLQEQPLELSELEAKVSATLRAERLAQLTALKRLAARGKLAAAVSWITDFLESGEPLVVFAHHKEVHATLLQRFPDALHLLGTDSIQRRNESVEAFQRPDGPQLIICSTRVASQGLTLTRSSNVCFLELDWTPAIHDQAEDRVHRIGQHDAVTAWYLLAANSIDETMATLIERKRGLIGAVTDGVKDDGAALVAQVVEELRGRQIRHLRRAS